MDHTNYLADIWPITNILAEICRYCGQYPSISSQYLAETDIVDIRVANTNTDMAATDVLFAYTDEVAIFISKPIYRSNPNDMN